MEDSFREQLLSLATGTVHWNCSLAARTTFGIGGPALALIEVDSVSQLRGLLDCCVAHGSPWRLIGRGSNLLVQDAGFKGVVFVLGKGFSEIRVLPGAEPSGVRLHVGAACTLTALLHWCCSQGFSGLEFTAGIPGTFGGAVVMNAGAFGEELAERLVSLEVLSPGAGSRILGLKDLDFGYRVWNNHGSGEGEMVVLGGELLLVRGEMEAVRGRCQGNLKSRKEKQPKGVQSAGSFFKNPAGASAGRLIEMAGMKGMSCGGAMVSVLHANFLVNTGGATAEDVVRLMDRVIEQVKKESGIELHPEVHFL